MLTGKVYKIVCGDLVYIGRTNGPLDKRLKGHKNDWKAGKEWGAYKLFEVGEPHIELLEEIEYEDHSWKLHFLERDYIRACPECVNKFKW
jgi:hypothetical protein